MKLDTFLFTFKQLCRKRDSQAANRPFAVILGAGASRSAGIPLASEMIKALRLLADTSRKQIPEAPDSETEWSWVFRQVLSAVAERRAFADCAREFVVECISRAQGEANVSHLLAAALANDGIMRAFADKTFMNGKTIYWFFTSWRRPAGPLMDAVKAEADVRFIRITDSDDLFLQLWDAAETNVSNEDDDRETLLAPAELFTFSSAFRTWMPTALVSKKSWWYPAHHWPNKKFAGLKKRLLPALQLADKRDEELLLYECLPLSLKNWFAYNALNVHGSQLPHLEWLEMFKILPVAVPWTRRNRKLVIRALSDSCPKGVRYQILYGLSEWGLWPREV